jgi:hypothetical protein
MREYGYPKRPRRANIGDELVTRDFGFGTLGFVASDDPNTPVSVSPGTELTFIGGVRFRPAGLASLWKPVIKHQAATFDRIKPEKLAAYEDVLVFPDARIPFERVCEGQLAIVSQLPT